MKGATLDAGALIALDRDDRRVLVLLARAAEVGARMTVPATALAQALTLLSRKSHPVATRPLGLQRVCYASS